MEISGFSFAQVPSIYFGNGSFKKLFEIVGNYKGEILLLTGRSSFRESENWDRLSSNFSSKGRIFHNEIIAKEPSPLIIDKITQKFRQSNIGLIISIGGGSVLDAGKAVSAMLKSDGSIKNYLEGVGSQKPNGKKIPFIAVPTTSGTGSEATKNAVVSEIGKNGFKKSLRHDNYIPDVAIVDPELTLSCPPEITASCGLDAFTQLLESYTSSTSNPITDALTLSGLEKINSSFLNLVKSDPSNLEDRAKVAYGSMISGVALANAGLGIVHGLASTVGGYFDIPHGVFCGTILESATRKNISKLREINSKKSEFYLRKYSKAGYLINNFCEGGIEKGCELLFEKLKLWTEELNLPKLSTYGIKKNDLDKIVENSGLKNNPVELSDSEMKQILLERL